MRKDIETIIYKKTKLSVLECANLSQDIINYLESKLKNGERKRI